MDMNIKVADREHPITKDLSDFTIHDETYKGNWFAKDNHVLLTTDHPKNDSTVCWIRPSGEPRRVPPTRPRCEGVRQSELSAS